jgi:hypothetical protein
VVTAEDGGGHEKSERRRLEPGRQSTLQKASKEPFLNRRVQQQVVGALHGQISRIWNIPSAIPPSQIVGEGSRHEKTAGAEDERDEKVPHRVRQREAKGTQRSMGEPGEQQWACGQRNESNNEVQTHPSPAVRH